MTDIDIFHRMIKKEAKMPIEDNYGKKIVRLTEPQHPISSVTIFGLPDNAIVIKADKFESPDVIFNNEKGECKRADFVIAADTGTDKVILCIEIKAKATTSSNKTIIQQLKGAQCFVAYCQEIGKVFWEQKTFLDNYVYRFITIRNISISKKMTRTPPMAGVHDHPDQMLKINSPHHLLFNHLVGKK